MKFRVNDAVVIIAGKDRGKAGKIIKVLPKKGRVVVEGVNKMIKHVKGRNGEAGERVEFFAPLDVSNVAIADPKDGKPSKIGYRVEGKTKIRFARKSGTVLPTGSKKIAKKVVKK
jgi:large subunit ribosomal protein L24